MKNLARKLLSENEKEQVNAAIQAAEKTTSGEIVCMIVSESYHYPMAAVIGAAVLALPLSLLAAYFAGGWLWLGTHNMWLFLGFFTVWFTLLYLVVKHSAGLKRIFTSRREMEEEVEEAAVTHFFQRGLHRTRDCTGILLFISVFEHKVWVLADQGINAQVPEGHWDALVARLTEGLRRNQAAVAICRAINTIGEDLRHHFPVKPDDTDELPNLIVEED